MEINGNKPGLIQTIKDLTQKFPLYSRIISGGLWKISGTAYAGVLSVIISALLARLLEPSQLGEYSYLLSVVVTIATVAKLGLGETAIREVAGASGSDPDETISDIIQQILKWFFFSLILITGIFLLLTERLGFFGSIMWITMGWIIMLSSQQLLVDMIRGFHNTEIATLLHGGRTGGPIAGTISVVVLAVLFFRQGSLSFNQAVVIMVIGTAGALLLTIYILRKIIRQRFEQFHFTSRLPSLAVLGMGVPVLIHSVSSIIQTQSSFWILKVFQPASDIALFSTAQQLAAFLIIQQNIILFVLSPEVAFLFSRKRIPRLEKVLRQSATIAAVPTLIGVLIYFFAGQKLLGFLYGDYYSSGYPVLIILASGYLVHVFSGSCGLTLMMTGNQVELMKISLASAILTVLISFLAVKALGVIGVAAAAALGMVIKNVLMIYQVKKKIGIWTFITLTWIR